MRCVLVFSIGFLVTLLVFESYHVAFLRSYFWEFAFLVYLVLSITICWFQISKFAITAFCAWIAVPFAVAAGATFDFTIRRVDRNLWPFEAIGLMLSFTLAFVMSYFVLRELGQLGKGSNLRDQRNPRKA
jgi:hypothetical protein